MSEETLARLLLPLRTLRQTERAFEQFPSLSLAVVALSAQFSAPVHAYLAHGSAECRREAQGTLSGVECAPK